MLADGENDVAAGATYLGSYLHSGGGCPDHHDATIRELAGIAVLHWRHGRDLGWDCSRERRHAGNVEGSGSQDDGRAMPFALVGQDEISLVGTTHR